MKDWVELHRRFVRISPEGARDLPSADVSHALGRTVGWDAVLAEPLALVLGQAGAGKTSELRERARVLREAGRAAFFVRMDAIASESELALAFASSDDQQAFEQWKVTDTEGALFIDALDECPGGTRDRDRALRRVLRGLGARLASVHIVVAARAAELTAPDGELLCRVLKQLEESRAGSSKPESSPKPEREEVSVPTFFLAPLSWGQIEAVAHREGVSDTAALRREIDSARALSLFARPMDVARQVAHWKAKRSLGSIREIIEREVAHRCEERREASDRPKNLSPGRAREGARKIALASLLAKRSSILNESIELPDDGSWLSSSDVLPEWTGTERAELLTRAMFDDAGHGRSRLHHRSLQDFLAAEELRQLRANALSDAELERVFIGTVGGQRVLRFHMRGALAWLAPWDQTALELAVELAPEMLIDEADPEALSLEQRQRVLGAYRARNAQRELVVHWLDGNIAARFFRRGLSSQIRDGLRPGNPLHLRRLLLDVIGRGEMGDLVEVALEVLREPQLDRQLASVAVEAVRRAGTAAQHESLVGTLDHAVSRDPEVLAELLEVLWPKHLDARQVVGALSNADRRAHHFTSLDAWPKKLVELCPDARLGELLDELCEAVQPRAEKVVGATWLAPALASAFTKAGSGLSRAEVERALRALAFAKSHGDGEYGDLDRVLRDSPELRRAIFRACSRPRARWRGRVVVSQRRPELTRLIDLFYIEQQDKPWLEQESTQPGEPWVRAAAFRALLTLELDGQQGESLEAAQQRMTELALRADGECGGRLLGTILERKSSRAGWDPSWGREGISGRYRLMERLRGTREERRREKARPNLEEIRAGTDIHGLWRVVADHRNGFDRSSPPDFDAIAQAWDPETAEATREGLNRAWRTCEVLPPSREREHPAVCLLALAGIATDLVEGLDISSMDASLKRRAVVAATAALNGFPSWLGELAQSDPELVREVYAPVLGWAFEPPIDPAGPEHRSSPLMALGRADQRIRTLLSDVVLDHLLGGEPAGTGTLGDALDALAGLSQSNDPRLVALIPERVRAAEADLPRLAVWWRQWLRVDGAAAVAWLEELLPQRSDADAVAIALFAKTIEKLPLDERRVVDRRPFDLSTDLLGRLYMLARRHVRPDGDRESGGAHVVTPRDNAEEFRSKLPSWLERLPGGAGLAELERLAETAETPAEREDWGLRIDRVRIDKASEAAWTIDQVRTLLEDKARPPTNARELFECALDRLDDLRRHVESGDYSERERYQGVQEKAVQLYVAAKLDLMRRDHFTVERESVVADDNRTDVRLRNPHFDGVLTIEIKLIEKWSMKDLERTIEHQLVDKYLRSDQSSHGVLLVARTAHEGGAARAPNAELVRRLNEEASRVQRERDDVDRLAVVLIDFTGASARAPSEGKGRRGNRHPRESATRSTTPQPSRLRRR